ncbi:aromatic-ring-hydroxylating dioxygenase subunit beta [Salicibibacter cibarius]|uniref:Aromatic-ring-hydroxylating dioxygenase subunit beta n=1 Tax=Salicibibacter cibarius TaxID=2743000 RepID=A0A7T6Z1S3_9BACI|nr:aromatic-ring-hydroxylating dioxygenase subunit beta [Salicibibacter cibarius]QQK74711.1 aromatic-ring-hydroxylating dioxygenase subunit beta [Salicibibacter cibarius]
MESTQNIITDIEEFIYKEADLINSEQLNEWLELFTDDAFYWIPSNSDDIDPKKHVSIIYDDRKRLEERVWRIESGQAYGQQPRSKTRHIISNVFIKDSDTDMVVVSSNFMIVEMRRSKQTIYSGRFEHQLVREESSWKIGSKKVELINNDEYLGNLSFIL